MDFIFWNCAMPTSMSVIISGETLDIRKVRFQTSTQRLANTPKT